MPKPGATRRDCVMTPSLSSPTWTWPGRLARGSSSIPLPRGIGPSLLRAADPCRTSPRRTARTGDAMTDLFDRTPLRQYPHRWRLSRAGFVNVWHYYENTFDISGGRLVLRGTNGSGKSRALEMLLPFLLDADRRNMGTGSSVRMEDLMSAGAGDQGNRLGYMWLELCREPDRELDDD